MSIRKGTTLIAGVASGGSGGLSSVSHDTTLTGDGTSSNPLGVASGQFASQSALSNLSDTVDIIESDITDINEEINSAKARLDVDEGNIQTISGKIPLSASSSNQLVPQSVLTSSVESAVKIAIFTGSASLSAVDTWATVTTTTTESDVMTAINAGKSVLFKITNTADSSIIDCRLIAHKIENSHLTLGEFTGIYEDIKFTLSYSWTADVFKIAKVSVYTLPIANSNTLGGVKPDGTTITATSDGTISADLSGYVPTSRTINNKALSSNITLTASDVDALPSSTVIPTVNNGTLTIQKNGTTLNTFTANSSTDITANITVPTKTSDLTNDSGFLTSHQDISGKADVDASNLTSANVTSWQDKCAFERVDLLYDKDSSDSSINWGYTSGMGSGVSKTFDFSKYKYLRITATNYTANITYFLNLKNADLTGVYSGVGSLPNADTSGLGALVLFGKAIVPSAKTSITVYSGFLRISTNSITSSYSTIKIEGVY